MAFNSNRKRVITISKPKIRGDEVFHLFLAIVILISLCLGFFRFLPIGKFIDDFIFAFLFGWIKYLVYLIALMWVIPFCFGYQLKVKPTFCVLMSLFLIVICWTTQTLTLLVLEKNQLWTNYQTLKFSHLLDSYVSTWWKTTILQNYHGFFVAPFTYEHFNYATFFPSYATGGIISNLLTGVFSYGYFVTACIANLLAFVFSLCWLLFNKPFIIFTKFKNGMIFLVKEIGKFNKHQQIRKKQKHNNQQLALSKAKLNTTNTNQAINHNNQTLTQKPPIVKQPKTLEEAKPLSPIDQTPTKPNVPYFNEDSHLTPFGKIKATNQQDDLIKNKGINVIKKSLESSVFNNPTATLSTTENKKQENNNPPLAFIPQPLTINQKYVLPHLKPQPLALTTKAQQTANHENALANQAKLTALFQQFNLKGEITTFHLGSTITKYEVALVPGTRVNKITSLEDDIKLTLGSNSIRIEAPIPGKALVGIEVPNEHIIPVNIQAMMEQITDSNRKLLCAIGKDSIGNYVFHALTEMPHLLIAGSTGSGKSVFINTLLISLLLRYQPHELKLVLIDPKWVELVSYNGIPHLLAPVINDAQKAPLALKVVLLEMERRYQLLAANSARNIESYNRKITDNSAKLPYYVIVIDELADLMIKNSKEIEEGIMRITQMGRAAGIHLVVATQRPSTDIITGVIKNNIPARIAFQVSSWIDSRTIIDSAGAEKLLGKGDMLFIAPGVVASTRIQAPWISEEEVSEILDFIKKQMPENYDHNFMAMMEHLKSK